MKTILTMMIITLLTSPSFANEDSVAVKDLKQRNLSAYNCEATGHSPDNSMQTVRKNGKHVFAKSEAEAYQLCLVKLDATLGYGPETNELLTFDSSNRLMIIDSVDLLKIDLP